MKRPPNPLTLPEGHPAVTAGCEQCHAVGKPNNDGTVGTCTECHSRHTSSVELARLPSTCGQCHMGPDHSQMEIYNESKHGVMFAAQRRSAEAQRRSAHADNARHVCAHMRDMPHERHQRPEGYAQSLGPLELVSGGGSKHEAAQLPAGADQHEAGLHAVPHAGDYRPCLHASRTGAGQHE